MTDTERAALFLNHRSDTHDHTCGALSHDCIEALATEFASVRLEGIREGSDVAKAYVINTERAEEERNEAVELLIEARPLIVGCGPDHDNACVKRNIDAFLAERETP